MGEKVISQEERRGKKGLHRSGAAEKKMQKCRGKRLAQVMGGGRGKKI